MNRIRINKLEKEAVHHSYKTAQMLKEVNAQIFGGCQMEMATEGAPMRL